MNHSKSRAKETRLMTRKPTTRRKKRGKFQKGTLLQLVYMHPINQFQVHIYFICFYLTRKHMNDSSFMCFCLIFFSFISKYLAPSSQDVTNQFIFLGTYLQCTLFIQLGNTRATRRLCLRIFGLFYYVIHVTNQPFFRRYVFTVLAIYLTRRHMRLVVHVFGLIFTLLQVSTHCHLYLLYVTNFQSFFPRYVFTMPAVYLTQRHMRLVVCVFGSYFLYILLSNTCN